MTHWLAAEVIHRLQRETFLCLSHHDDNDDYGHDNLTVREDDKDGSDDDKDGSDDDKDDKARWEVLSSHAILGKGNNRLATTASS